MPQLHVAAQMSSPWFSAKGRSTSGRTSGINGDIIQLRFDIVVTILIGMFTGELGLFA